MRNKVGATLGVALVAALIVGCQTSSTGGLVNEPAQNAAQQNRLDAYEIYGEDGRSPTWVDQHFCFSDAAFAVTFTAQHESYPDDNYTVPSKRADAVDVGDDAMVAAIDEGVAQGKALASDPNLTSREAIENAVEYCDTTELGEDYVRDTIGKIVETHYQLTSAGAYQFGGPVWVPPDGTYEWRASPFVPTPEPLETSEPDAPASLDETFALMLFAMAQDGEDGLWSFLASPEEGDVWGILDWEWSDPQCFQTADPPACVATFHKGGEDIENVFEFVEDDGRWLLTSSYVW